MKLEAVIHQLNRYAPPAYAMNWDNVGLQLGSKTREINHIMLALTIDESVVSRAIEESVDLIISHHPLIFKPLHNIASDYPLNNWIVRLIKSDIACFSMHTNLDVVPEGVSDALAEQVGLSNIKVLSQTSADSLLKLVVYIPPESVEKVTHAIFEAGAGFIGHYSNCGFTMEGVGTFKGDTGTTPYIGQPDVLARTRESRFETIVRESDLERVLSAMFQSHPYEEVAYDIVSLQQKGQRYGLGRYGHLRQSGTIAELAARLGAQIKGARVEGMIHKVAVCGGSGADLIPKVAKLGLSCYITGDITYHDEVLAAALGVTVLDMGHYESEIFVLPKIERYLKKIYDKKVNIITVL